MMPQYDFESARQRFIGRMFPGGAQRDYADHLASGDSYDYRETEVLNGLLQIDEAYFNQAVEDCNPNAGNFLYPLIDHAEFKDEIAAIAGNYVEVPKLHTKPLTLFLILALLDTELYPLRRDARNPLDVLARGTNNPRVKLAIIGQTGFVRATRWIAFVLVGAAAFAAFAYDVVWLGAALSALFLWDLFGTVVTSRRVKKGAALTEAHMTASLRSLELIRRELATGAIDPDAMRERLKRAEESGAYVPSMIYPLLQMSVLRYAA